MTRWLMRCGVIGPIVFVSGFWILGARRPGYRPRYTFASQLGLNGGGRVWRTVNVIAGLLMAAFGVGLRRTMSKGAASSSGWLAVVAGGLGFVTFGISRDDPWLLYPPGAPRGIGIPVSRSGWGHQAGALSAGLGLETAHVLFTRHFALQGEPASARYSFVTAILFPSLYGAAIVSGMASRSPGNRLGGSAGLLQKASLATTLAWVAWLAGHVLSTPVPDETA